MAVASCGIGGSGYGRLYSLPQRGDLLTAPVSSVCFCGGF